MSDADLRASRARLHARAVSDRQGFERALHDGLQQELIAVSVQLQLLARALDDDPPAARALVDEVRRSVRDALTRTQELARSVYPPLLELGGLVDALRDAARAAGVSAHIDGVVGRYPAGLEAAVYFCVASAISSLAPGGELSILLREQGEVLTIELDGRFEAVAVTDLVEAAGGAAHVDGAKLTARIPLRQSVAER